MTSQSQALLFPEEKVEFQLVHPLPVFGHDKEAINAKYVKGEVRIVTEQARYPLNTVVTMVESPDYKLNPDFQRRHRWDPHKQSRLIESFIMNVPIPPVFLYEESYSQYEVMDGLQRMTAIYEFYKDRYPLQGLEEWKELNGLTYSQLPDQVRKGIDRRYLSSIILLQETAKTPEEAQRLKQLVFERINSGGVKLEPQEARNAIYDGPLNRLCIRLARNPYLCRTWGIPEPTAEEITTPGTYSQELLGNETFRRMDDVELVLRFFAYRQRLSHDHTSLKDYLDAFLREGNRFSTTLLAQYEDLFVTTIELVYQTLGPRAFWLYRERNGSWNWYSRPTRVLFDPIMHGFSQVLQNKDQLLAKQKEIRLQLEEFYQKQYDVFGGRSVNRSDIVARNEAFATFLSGFIEK
jgi:hypothetical protein